MKEKTPKLIMTLLFAVMLTTVKAENVSVTLSREGTLAEKVLEQAASLSSVTELIVNGPINELDWRCVVSQMTNVEIIDMKDATASFNTINTLGHTVRQFIMPTGIINLDVRLGYNDVLQSLELSNTVENLSGSFDNDYTFTTLKIGSGLKSIRGCVFGWARVLSEIYVDDIQTLLNIQYESNESCLTYKERDYLSDRYIYVNGEKLTKLTVSNVENIHPFAFYGIPGLQEVILSEDVKHIGDMAFADCPALIQCTLPSTLESLGQSTFSGCTMLQTISIPNGIVSIPNNCFYNNIHLTMAEMPSTLTSIGHNAFLRCSALQELTFPETLQKIGNSAFAGCSGLTKVTSLIPFPIAATNGIFSGIDIDKCTLVVPEWSAMLYKMAMGWSEFAKIETVPTGNLSSLTVTDTHYLPATVRPNGTPDVSILSTGSLTVRGESPFNMSEVTLGANIGEGQRKYGYDDNDNYYEYYAPSLAGAVLINDESNISAKSARIKLESIGGTWGFITLPFDVKLSDITNDPEVEASNYVFKYYDGERRGLVGTGGNWLEASNILKAGTGYIYQSQDSASIYLKATPETVANICNKNNIKTTLQDYASENAEDAGWNFIGNPYPAYFDTHYIDFTAPITVWNGQGYDAISLTDDDYVLSPYQAFFVQKQTDGNSITFFADGRLAENRETNTTNRVASRYANVSGDRDIYNIYLSNEKYTDKCRIVINEQSKIGYDAANDAVKFFSDDITLPQIYTLGEKGVEYSINERPIESGIIEMGVRATKGSYCITSDSDTPIYLIDRMENQTVDLSISDYEFIASESDSGRFAISMTRDMSSISEVADCTTTLTVSGEILSIKCGSIESINIYSLDGVNVVSLNGCDNYSVKLSQGIYLVKTRNSVEKVVIR